MNQLTEIHRAARRAARVIPPLRRLREERSHWRARAEAAEADLARTQREAARIHKQSPDQAPRASTGRASAGGGGIRTDKIASLVFGPALATPEGRGAAASYLGGLEQFAPSGRIKNAAELRRLLGATNRMVLPSSVFVRLDSADTQVVENDDFKIVIDSYDPAVGLHIMLEREWEPHTSSVMRRYVAPGMTVLDVGANIGWHSLLAASLVGPRGRVIAVEPWSENCRLLILSAILNSFDQIELWPFALDSKRGWANFMSYVGSNAGFQPNSEEALGSGFSNIVPCFALDEMLEADIQIDFMKIDVEGGEYRVILGAQRVLETSRPTIISEFSPWMTQRNSQADPADYLEWFYSRGWSLNVIRREDGTLVPFGSVKDCLAWWPIENEHHIEDLLLIPTDK